MALSLLVGGCTTLGPDFKPPEAPESKSWLETKDPRVNSKTVDYSSWWSVLNDPVLNKLIKIAYNQNLTLRTAGIRILEARAQLGIATGAQYPQLQTLGGGYQANRSSRNDPLFGEGSDRTFDSFDLGFDAAWELDFWGRFRRGVESADANLIASIAEYDDVLVTLTAEVARAYVSIRTFEERIVIARRNVEIQARSLQIAEVRFRNGATTELDVRQAESLLRNTEALIPELQLGRRQAINALNTLLGMPPSELQSILSGPEAIPVPPAEVAVGVPAELLRRRPDIRQAELQAAAQSALIGVATADLYPSFSIAGSIGYLADDGRELFESDSLTGIIRPGFSWNIFNYGRLKNNVRAQDARFQQLIVTYQNTVLNAYQEVEDALVGILRSQEQVGFLSQAVQATARSVDLAVVQYRDGVADYTRVLNTQTALVDQQDRLTSTRGNVVLSLVAMYKGLGGGWQLRYGKPFVPENTVDEMRDRTDWGRLLPPKKELPKELEPPPRAKEQKLFPRPDW